MYCKKCGFKNIDDANYCQKCGIKLSSSRTCGSEVSLIQKHNEKIQKGKLSMKKHLALIVSAALMLSMSACGADTSGNTSNDAGGISAGLGEIGEKVGDLLGIESKEEKVLENPLFKEGLLAVKVDGKWGYIDESGEFVIEPQFLNAENFQSNRLAIVSAEWNDENGDTQELYGVIDKNGNYVIEPKYHTIEKFNEDGVAKVSGNLHMNSYLGYVYDWGLINENGEVILEPRYYEIGDFICGWARVDDFYYDTRYNYIDKDGNLLINYANTKFGYDSLTYVGDFCSNGLAKVETKDGYDYITGFIDTNGNCPIEIKYYALGEFTDSDLIYASIDGEKYGFIDKNGNYVIKPQFDNAEDFDYNGYAKVNIGFKFDMLHGVTNAGKWGLIDKSGNYVVQPIYDEITKIEYDVAIVRLDDKYGFVNLKNGVTVEPEYDKISFESDKYIYIAYFTPDFDYKIFYMDFDGNIDSNANNAVYIYDRYIGFIDSDDNIQIDKECLKNIYFNGVRFFYYNRGSGIIDADGNIILLPRAYITSEFNANGIAIINESDNEGKSVYGYIKTNGEYLIEPQYKDATQFYDDNYAVVKKNDKYEIINENGEIVFNQQFEKFLF